MTIRTLVLSGGGGRGAFHAGVYNYLMQGDKPGIAASHQGAWQPDIVVGTSIGAVNGAAITQGISPSELESFWLSLREDDIQGIPPGMGPVARWTWNTVLKSAIGVRLPRTAQDEAMSPGVEDSWPPLPVMPRPLSKRLIGQWNNLLDTAPLYNTLMTRLGLDEDAINTSETALLISATNVRTGEGVIFTNDRPCYTRSGDRRGGVRERITLKRIVASCSIPLVYPWTTDDDGEIYWDGAVVANTPMGAAFDVMRQHPIEEDMEVVVVMMTPWWETHEDTVQHGQLPQDFGEALTWTLDWALLASFRVDLKLMRSFNEIADIQRQANQARTYRYVHEVIVAPQDFLPVERIIDYDEEASRQLIAMGYQAAARAFAKRWPA
jgi:NTE family protein